MTKKKLYNPNKKDEDLNNPTPFVSYKKGNGVNQNSLANNLPRYAIYLFSAIILILMIALIASSITKNKRIKDKTKYTAKTEAEQKTPYNFDKPSRSLPEGKIGEWSKSVIFIEAGEIVNQGSQFAGVKSGTGFVISEKGYILTNNHVIEGANDILLTFYDGTVKKAQIIKSDAEIDAALLKVELPLGIKSLKLYINEDVAIGRRILVMGFPLGTQLGSEMTLTDGLLSSIRRNQFKEILWYQISAPVNPGNSGGPLLDSESGDVLGMVTAKVGEAENIGFARPSSFLNKYFIKGADAK